LLKISATDQTTFECFGPCGGVDKKEIEMNRFSFGILILFLAQAAWSEPLQLTLFHSDTFDAKLSRRPVIFPNVIQMQPNQITDGKIKITVASMGSRKLNIDSLRRPSARPNELELYLLQILYALQSAKNFYSAIGIQIPPLDVTIEDPQTPPMANAGGQSIRFAKLSDRYPFRKLIPMIGDVAIHELTHIAQGQHKVRLIDSRLGLSSFEGHANLMTYLITGRTDLGILNGEPGMRVLTNDKFGRVPGGNYNSYQPFSSVLVKLHRFILRKATSPDRKFELHRRISRIYFEMLTKQRVDDGYQDLLKNTIHELNQNGLLSAQDFQTVEKILRQHGISLATRLHDGYTAAILVNGLSPDSAGSWLLHHAKSKSFFNPRVRLQKGVFEEVPKHQPIFGFVLHGPTAFARASVLINSQLEKLSANPGETSRPPDLKKLQFQALQQIAKEGTDLGGVFVEQAILTFHNDQELEVRAKNGRDRAPCLNGFVMGLLMVLTSDGTEIGQAPLPFACR